MYLLNLAVNLDSPFPMGVKLPFDPIGLLMNVR